MSDSGNRTYCLDTNVLIEPWNKYYSMELCPEYWDIIENLAKNQVVFCTFEVRREIEKVDDELFKWVGSRPYLFRDETPQVQHYLRQILAKFLRLVDTRKDRSMADPWVIAHAQAENAVVVTKESRAPKKIKIPDVCMAFNIPWMNDFEFLSEIGVKFSAKIE